MELKWIQKYMGNGQCLPPPCEKCSSMAVGMWSMNGKALDLCHKHAKEMNAPPMIYGVIYAPSETRIK